MRFFRILTVAAALTALSVGATCSNAATITGLFNTGVNAGGVALAPGTADSHYSVISTPPGGGGPGSAITVGPNGSFPIPPWALNTATYTWISGPNSAGSPPVNPTFNGEYVYRTNFTATDTGVVSIAGAATADDQIVRILINGAPAILTGLPSPDQSFSSIFPFTATGGAALVGLNTLDFVVNNTHSVVQGLQVSSLSGFTTVPEPLSLVMLGSGLAGIVGIGALRRMKKPVA